MKKTNPCIPIAILVAIALSVAAGAAAAEEPEPGEPTSTEQQRARDWYLRFGFVAAETDGRTSVAVDPGSVDVSLSGGGGGFVSLERRVTPLLGLEFGMTGFGANMNVSTHIGLKHVGAEVDLLSMGALTFGANFHVVKEGGVDVWAGPLLTLNRYSEWSVRSGIDGHWWPSDHDDWVSARVKSDSEVSWGAKAGIDVFLGKKKKWTLGCSLTYLEATYDFEQGSGSETSSISLDPLLFSFGAGFRF
jgi:opacity protein-like surface antigen